MGATYLRLATMADLPAVMAMIHEAKIFLADQGIHQWQTGEPTDQELENNVANHLTYVLVSHEQITATATLHQGLEPYYPEIEGGTWLNGSNEQYTTIHRMTVASAFRGRAFADKLISGLITVSSVLGYQDVRIDTHPENLGMQHVITKNGFQKRGTIYLGTRDEPRIAYQLLIK